MRLAAVLSIVAATAVPPATLSARIAIPGSPAQAKPASVARSVITDPTWAIRPLPEYPEVAMGRDIRRGRVDLECRVAHDGQLSACEILQEGPEGVGFGRAALRAAAGARISLDRTEDLPANAVVRFTVTFAMN